MRSAITRVTIVPDSVDALAHHEPGLWGAAPDERVHHALSRVQSLLGHEAVLTAQRTGGRTLAERAMLITSALQYRPYEVGAQKRRLINTYSDVTGGRASPRLR